MFEYIRKVGIYKLKKKYTKYIYKFVIFYNIVILLIIIIVKIIII